MLPEGAEIFDAHVHLGHDIDGMIGLYEQLEGRLDEYNISRCFMFCMDEHDRHPAFRVPNDRTLAAAERSNGRMVPFVRLDLNEDPIEEAVRCLDRGARGNQAPSACAALRPQRRAPRARVRAGRRPTGADPDPRRAGFAADRRQPRAPGRPVPRPADHRPRGNRRPRRARTGLRRPRRSLLRHLGLEPDRPARLLPPVLARAGRVRLRLPLRAAADVAPDRSADGAAQRLRRRADARDARAATRAGSRTANHS